MRREQDKSFLDYFYVPAVVCNIVSATRSFAGGFGFVKSILSLSLWPRFIFGSFMGSLVSVAPLRQSTNSVIKLFEHFKKPGALKYLAPAAPLALAAAISFAEMGGSEFQSTLQHDMPFMDRVSEDFINGIIIAVSILTIISQTLMYTDKVSQLKIKTLICEDFKKHPILFFFNGVGAVIGTITNFNYGLRAFYHFFSNTIGGYIFGAVSQIGPGSLAFVDSWQLIKTHSLCCEDNKMVINTNPSITSTISFQDFTAREIFIAALWASVAAIPNTYFNLTSNYQGPDPWSITKLSIGILWNVVPKFVANLETQQRENREEDEKFNNLRFFSDEGVEDEERILPGLSYQPLQNGDYNSR
jgi:hypothetical protein